MELECSPCKCEGTLWVLQLSIVQKHDQTTAGYRHQQTNDYTDNGYIQVDFTTNLDCRQLDKQQVSVMLQWHNSQESVSSHSPTFPLKLCQLSKHQHTQKNGTFGRLEMCKEQQKVAQLTPEITVGHMTHVTWHQNTRTRLWYLIGQHLSCLWFDWSRRDVNGFVSIYRVFRETLGSIWSHVLSCFFTVVRLLFFFLSPYFLNPVQKQCGLCTLPLFFFGPPAVRDDAVFPSRVFRLHEPR